MYYDSDNAYCELTAVMDDTGNPEVFYISEIPIEGFEGLCPYLSYWSESEVRTDAWGDYIYGPDARKLYITEEYEFSEIVYGGDSGEDYSGDLPSEEPVWYEFIVSDDVESWAVVMSYDENMQEFYLWTAANDICQLNVDYSTASATTYYLDIQDCPECRCSYLEEYGWTQSPVTYEEAGPISMTGPFGYTWYFLDLDEFQSENPEYFEEFSDLIWSDEISETSYSYDDYDYYYNSNYDNYDYSDQYFDGYYDENYYDDWEYYYDDYG